HLRTGVERVDGHLAVGGAGELDAAVGDARSGWGDLPTVVLTDVLGLREEVEVLAGRDPVLAILAGLQQLLATGLELTVQLGNEREGVLGDELVVSVAGGVGDFDPGHGTREKA